MSIVTKRVYEPADKADGYRVLIDRLWPRGLKKEAVPLDLWAKELATSTALRPWFGNDPALWDGFRHRYAHEPAARAEHRHPMTDKAARPTATLHPPHRE